MRQNLCFFEIESVAARHRIMMANVIIAEDGDEEAVLYSDPKAGGSVLVVEMGPGDILFESADFRRLCSMVSKLKGGCCFKIAAAIQTVEMFKDELGPTNRIADSQSLESYLRNDDDDDEPANWWKRGDA